MTSCSWSICGENNKSFNITLACLAKINSYVLMIPISAQADMVLAYYQNILVSPDYCKSSNSILFQNHQSSPI